MTAFDRRYGALGGVGGGLLAAVFSYAFTYILAVDHVRSAEITETIQGLTDGAVVPKIVGWVFFNAHNAATTIHIEAFIFSDTTVVNLISRSSTLSPLLYVIPPLLLIAAGILAARLGGATEARDVAIAGPAVVLGYLPVVAGLVFYTTITVGDSWGGPTMVPAIVFAGIAYPLIFGSIGAGVATGIARVLSSD